MSTTIYHGYKLPAMTSIELNAFILRFRALAEKKASQLCATALSNLISHDLDELAVFGKDEFIKRNLKRSRVSGEDDDKKFQYCSVFTHAYMDMRDRYYEIQRISRRDPAMDFDCNAIFIPLEDKTLVLLYAESKELRELWESMGEVSEYQYWDNVESPEEVTNEEWEERKKIWLEIWPASKQVKEIGLDVVFVQGLPERSEIEMDDVITNMSSFDKRASYVAWNKLFDDKFREMKSEDEEWLETNSKVSRWMRSVDGKTELQEQTELCKNKMIPKFTVSHLRKSYQEIFNQLSKKQD